MRFMVMVKATEDSEAGILPSEQLLREMGNYNEELVKAGVMLAGEGLQPSSKGVRVRFNGEKRTVIDGPFAETKELIAGFWIMQARSLEEAIEWVKRVPNPFPGESEIEIRQVFEAEDFGAQYTPELREQEESQRVRIEAQQAPPTKMFVNLPIKDLDRSVQFFTRLGYKFNPQFTDENATCMIVGEDNYVMLLVEKYFKTFIEKPLASPSKATGSLVALSCNSRGDVDRVVKTALAAGARPHKEPQDLEFMYQWGFEDPDGHIWEYFWMDTAATPS